MLQGDGISRALPRRSFRAKAGLTVIKVHKDESFPKPQVYRMQRIIRLLEFSYLVHVRRADQFTVEPVGPRVIRTLNCRCMAACIFFQPCPAMATDIVECSDH